MAMRTFAEKAKAAQQATSARSTIPVRGHFGQSPEVRSILHLQRTIGNRALQAKLAINEPGDSYEQDADRMAEQVMRTPEPQNLQAKSVQAGDVGQGVAPPSVDAVLRSSGQPLDPATRSFMEPRFGHDFSQVRVHTGTAAEESARDVNAHAYAVGHDVVFGPGRFAPGTQEGRRLIAHELAHTLQQSGGAPRAIARQPKEAPFAVNQQDMVKLQNTMLKFYSLLPASDRASLYGRSTIVIALVSHENQPTLVYTVAGNRINPRIEAAATQLGLTRWDPEGIDKVAGERHAEQLTLEAASRNGFKVHGIAVTREPCPDCGPVVGGKGVPIVWVRDPNHLPGMSRTPGAAGGSPPAGGIPSTPPPSQPPTPAPATAKPATASKVTAEVGAPLKPVSEATPGYRPAAGAALGGALQMLQSKMLGNLQQAEIAKFEKRLAELQPQIDKQLRSGNSVELIVVVEKPNTYDFLCGAGAFCDQSQLTYFNRMWIRGVQSVEPVAGYAQRGTSRQTSVWPTGGGEGFVPYTHQGGSIIDESEIPFLSTRDPLHHCEYEKVTLYPQESIAPLAANHLPPQPMTPQAPLNTEAQKALAKAPSRVYMMTGNIFQYETAVGIQKKLADNPSFGEVKQYTASMYGSRTIVSYVSYLDKPRAEALAEFLRSEGVHSAHVQQSGIGYDNPGVLQIFFSRDAESVRKPASKASPPH